MKLFMIFPCWHSPVVWHSQDLHIATARLHQWPPRKTLAPPPRRPEGPPAGASPSRHLAQPGGSGILPGEWWLKQPKTINSLGFRGDQRIKVVKAAKMVDLSINYKDLSTDVGVFAGQTFGWNQPCDRMAQKNVWLTIWIIYRYLSSKHWHFSDRKSWIWPWKLQWFDQWILFPRLRAKLEGSSSTPIHGKCYRKMMENVEEGVLNPNLVGRKHGIPVAGE